MTNRNEVIQWIKDKKAVVNQEIEKVAKVSGVGYEKIGGETVFTGDGWCEIVTGASEKAIVKKFPDVKTSAVDVRTKKGIHTLLQVKTEDGVVPVDFFENLQDKPTNSDVVKVHASGEKGAEEQTNALFKKRAGFNIGDFTDLVDILSR